MRDRPRGARPLRPRGHCIERPARTDETRRRKGAYGPFSGRSRRACGSDSPEVVVAARLSRVTSKPFLSVCTCAKRSPQCFSEARTRPLRAVCQRRSLNAGGDENIDDAATATSSLAVACSLGTWDGRGACSSRQKHSRNKVSVLCPKYTPRVLCLLAACGRASTRMCW